MEFVCITFRDGVPQKTTGGHGKTLPSLVENHALYAESLVHIPAHGIVDFWISVLT